jgi:hypothetical protein
MTRDTLHCIVDWSSAAFGSGLKILNFGVFQAENNRENFVGRITGKTEDLLDENFSCSPSLS